MSRVRVGGFLPTISTPFGTVDFNDPVVILRALPFTGWVGFLAGAFQGAGVLAQGGEVAAHLAPGLVQGESFSDAFMADYGARLKIAATVLGGQELAAASPTVDAAMSDAVAEVQGAAAQAGQHLTSTQIQVALAKMTSDEADAVLQKGRDALVKELGPTSANQLLGQIAGNVDDQLNQAFAKAVQDPGLTAALAKIAKSFGTAPIDPSQLAAVNLAPSDVASSLGIRQDVAALAENALLHRRVYDVSPRRFDPVTGDMIPPTQVPAFSSQVLTSGASGAASAFLGRHPDDGNRTSGANSDWALIDLLAAQQANQPAAAVQALQDDYQRALGVDRAIEANKGADLDPDDVLAEYAVARTRGADPHYVKALEDGFSAAAGLPSPDVAISAHLGGLPVITQGPGLRGFLTVAALLAPAWLPLAWTWWRNR